MAAIHDQQSLNSDPSRNWSQLSDYNHLTGIPDAARRCLCLQRAFQMALIDDDLPSSHEITWAHVWLFTCFAFIVAAQFQLVAYAWLIRIRARRSAAQRNAEQQRRSARVASGSAEGHTNEHSVRLAPICSRLLSLLRFAFRRLCYPEKVIRRKSSSPCSASRPYSTWCAY